MTWTYQIVEDKKQKCFTLCEVFYDEGKKKPWGYAETDIVGESVEDIKEILEMMIEDVKHYPVLKTTDFKKPKKEKELLKKYFPKKGEKLEG